MAFVRALGHWHFWQEAGLACVFARAGLIEAIAVGFTRSPSGLWEEVLLGQAFGCSGQSTTVVCGYTLSC